MLPAELTEAAAHAGRAAEDLGHTVRAGAGMLRHGGPGLLMDAALDGCAQTWITRLGGLSEAVQGVADRLSETVAGYQRADEENATRFRAIGGR
ncbi:hypothetical protein GTS_26320 [Gandjariella thermophila]|uniref:ESX-1 secretion-associated protein n=1 Tax=Gandjariella thermophila TaxID=1931992 RepID=A0A4D4J9A8_9PSEU|nr:hypothetical protein GTS_26320 [Gandjariella thermophila]